LIVKQQKLFTIIKKALKALFLVFLLGFYFN